MQKNKIYLSVYHSLILDGKTLSMNKTPIEVLRFKNYCRIILSI